MNLEIITNVRHQDLSLIARCHRKAFPRALSTAMGQMYCEKMLEWYISDSRTLIFYLRTNGDCIGYCGGLIFDGIHPGGSASSMIQYSFHAAVKAILLRPWLFFHPEFIRKYRLVLKNVWRKFLKWTGKPYKALPPANIPPHAGLVVIGVSPEHQGKGVGGILLQEFENQAKSRGYNLLRLTVLQTNTQAIKAYQKNGWVITETKGNSVAMEKVLEKND